MQDLFSEIGHHFFASREAKVSSHRSFGLRVVVAMLHHSVAVHLRDAFHAVVREVKVEVAFLEGFVCVVLFHAPRVTVFSPSTTIIFVFFDPQLTKVFFDSVGTPPARVEHS